METPKYLQTENPIGELGKVAAPHESTGLIPQVSNVTYGTSASIDMTSMPIGTVYFQHEA